MNLKQILVEATDYSDPRGNVIASRTPGIEDEHATQMAKWATVRGGLLPRQFNAVFYSRINHRLSIVGRTFVGGYDQRGERSLYSQIVLVPSKQLRGFQNNAILLMQMLTSSGKWILETTTPAALPEIELPDSPMNSFAYHQGSIQTEKILQAVDLHDRVGFTDAEEPMLFMGRFLQSLEMKRRPKISFSIGRRYLESSPFQVSFYTGNDLHLEQELTKNQVYPIRLRSVQKQNVGV